MNQTFKNLKKKRTKEDLRRELAIKAKQGATDVADSYVTAIWRIQTAIGIPFKDIPNLMVGHVLIAIEQIQKEDKANNPKK